MRPHRRSIHLPGSGHASAPIPSATRVGNILVSSAIGGKDPQTGKLGETPADQIALAFSNMDTLLTAGDADLGDVARLTVYLASDDLRAAVNTEWLKRFPDPDDRPARHIQLQTLSHGMVIQIELLAVLKGDAR